MHSESDADGEEHLKGGFCPDDRLVQLFIPWLQIVTDAGHCEIDENQSIKLIKQLFNNFIARLTCAFQKKPSNQQNGQNDVRRNGSHPDDLSGRFDSFEQGKIKKKKGEHHAVDQFRFDVAQFRKALGLMNFEQFPPDQTARKQRNLA